MGPWATSAPSGRGLGAGCPRPARRPRPGCGRWWSRTRPSSPTLVGSYLERDGFEVTVATTGGQAVTAAREVDPDVIVLDLGLPGLDGIEVCRQVRTFSDAYVVMLTARSDEVDTLIGLSVGADDYMTKPFSPRELMARIQAMLRRPRAAGPRRPTRRRRRRGRSVPLTHRPDRRGTCGSTATRWR